MNDIWDYVRVYNLMPYKFCQSLIRQYEDDDQWQKHFWYNAKGVSSQYEDKELDVRFSTASVELNPYISQSIDQYCEDVGLEREAITEWSTPRLNRYREETMMREHSDLIRRHRRDGVPVLSLVGQMNDGYEGGEFMMRGEQLHLQTGDILVFPSTFIYPHEVREITQGCRWSWVVWAY